ncbi:MAG: pyridoxamine 5'-phosphate oxidase family protein [Terracidiphilus sp.]|jgi:uncharacterized protein YhbP (UPF0306 family)
MDDRRKELETVAALLREESTLALATTDEQGQPCVTPLFYIPDEELTLFWLSSRTSLHSRNLKRAPMAAAAIYRHTENWKEIRGVQLRGPVTVIADPGRRRALIAAYCERFQLGAVFKTAIGQCTLYALRPVFFRYIDNSRVFGHKFEIALEDE